MSVLIKGMDMPTSCLACPFMVSGKNDYCILQSEEANKKIKTFVDMINGCPLAEVPKHGRLVDADAEEATSNG